jgi:hypothetical protein
VSFGCALALIIGTDNFSMQDQGPVFKPAAMANFR